MEIIALIGGIVAAIVFVAERLAFAVMLYMLCSWVYRATKPLWRWADREMAGLFSHLRSARDAVLAWWTFRSLRTQMAVR